MRDHYTLSAEESLSALQTNECGLSAEEAEKRLKTYGRNELCRKKKKGPLRLFLAQFTDFMTILLICAAAITAVTAFVTGDKHELVDTGILLFIILLNTFVGFIQQYRADNAIEKLKSLSGLSANEFIRKIRMHKAEELLSKGDCNVSEAAWSVGISSIIYFRQCFKHEFGVLPSEYRRSRHGKPSGSGR